MAKPPLHERLHFDVARGQVLDADRRYVLLRADVLMGMFAFLSQPASGEALLAFARSVATYGSGSVRAYDDPADPASLQLFDAVAQGASSLGWGVWSFEPGPRSCRLTVRNSPFAAAFRKMGRPACAPIAGMMQAVCSHAWKQDCAVVEVECSACTGQEHAADEGLCRIPGDIPGARALPQSIVTPVSTITGFIFSTSARTKLSNFSGDMLTRV
jgi:predicted hydrocarbon binding protein